MMCCLCKEPATRFCNKDRLAFCQRHWRSHKQRTDDWGRIEACTAKEINAEDL